MNAAIAENIPQVIPVNTTAASQVRHPKRKRNDFIGLDRAETVEAARAAANEVHHAVSEKKSIEIVCSLRDRKSKITLHGENENTAVLRWRR